MTSLNLTPEEFKAVEQTRQRVYQLTESIGTVKSSVLHSMTLPDLMSLQNSVEALQTNMQSLVEVISNNNDLFSRIAVHPSTNFPGRTQEMVLLQLLRKKPEPEVAASMDEGRNMFRELGDENVHQMFEEKWPSVRDFIADGFAQYLSEDSRDPYTAEEREMGIENVRTGLRKPLEMDEAEEYDDEDEDEDDDEEMGKAKTSGGMDDDDDLVMLDRPPQPIVPVQTTSQPAEDTEGIPLENLLRLASRGELLAG